MPIRQAIDAPPFRRTRSSTSAPVVLSRETGAPHWPVRGHPTDRHPRLIAELANVIRRYDRLMEHATPRHRVRASATRFMSPASTPKLSAHEGANGAGKGGGGVKRRGKKKKKRSTGSSRTTRAPPPTTKRRGSSTRCTLGGAPGTEHLRPSPAQSSPSNRKSMSSTSSSITMSRPSHTSTGWDQCTCRRKR